MSKSKSIKRGQWEGTVWKRNDTEGWFRFVLHEFGNDHSLEVVTVFGKQAHADQTSKTAISRWGVQSSWEAAVDEIPEFAALVADHQKSLVKAVPSLQQWAMMIAGWVRLQMEDFHVQHLSDEQMKELNPIIRQAIFDAIVAVWRLKSRKQEDRMLGAAIVGHAFANCGSEWELPELADDPEFKRLVNEHGPITAALSKGETIEFITKHLNVI